MKLPLVSNVRECRANKQLIDVLLRSRLFPDYERVFTKATGLPLALRPLEYWQREQHGKKPREPILRFAGEQLATVAVFLQANEGMMRHIGDGIHLMVCGHGYLKPIASISPSHLERRRSASLGRARTAQFFARSGEHVICVSR